MRPDKQSTSFTFHRNVFNSSSGSSTHSNSAKIYNCRKKLQDRFNEDKTGGNQSGNDSQNSSNSADRSVLSVLNLNETRKILRESADRISKTFSTVRTSLGTFSQKFRIPTKRRQILEEGPMTPNPQTPQTTSRNILGRTPTKLYSPFSVESPYAATTLTMAEKENMLPKSNKYPWQR